MGLLINVVFINYKAMNAKQEQIITEKAIRNKKRLQRMKRSNSINIQNSINVNIYQKYNDIYSGFNDNNKFTYEFVKEKSTTCNTKTPISTKYDSYQRGSKRVTNITKEQSEINVNRQNEKKKRSNSSLSYIDKLYKNESYPKKQINNSYELDKEMCQAKSRNINNNRLKNKTTKKTFNKYSTASCSGSLNESFSYKPSLNKTSLKIASTLESSMQRLTKKRKVYSTNHNNSYTFDINSNPTIKRYPSTSNKKIEEMYKKGLAQIEIKKQLFNENKMKKENEYQQFAFTPITNKDSIIFDNMREKHKPAFSYNIQSSWYSKVHKRNDIKKIKFDEEVIQQCTFSPRIKQLNINNDSNIIKSQIPAINDYVNQRRIVIENTKRINEENEKILGNNQDFQIKITVPKEFRFNQRKPYNHSQTSPIAIEENRKELGIDSFFNETTAIYIDHNKSFLNS